MASYYTQFTTTQAFVPLPLSAWRIIASNDIPVLAGTPASGISASDTLPKLIRKSTSTDKQLTIQWAATSVIEIATHFLYPPDLDATTTYTVNIRAAMAATNDTPLVAIGVFEGVGDTNRGTNTTAVTGTAVATYSVTVTPTAGHPNQAAISLIPAAHGTDILFLYSAYILYTRKFLAS